MRSLNSVDNNVDSVLYIRPKLSAWQEERLHLRGLKIPKKEYAQGVRPAHILFSDTSC